MLLPGKHGRIALSCGSHGGNGSPFLSVGVHGFDHIKNQNLFLEKGFSAAILDPDGSGGRDAVYINEASAVKTIYKNEYSKSETLSLYDRQLSKLDCKFKDIYVATSVGQTHIVETGNRNGKPLLVFHGGNSTTAYNLLICRYLLRDFHVYAVDIVGHPGKSAETSLPSHGYAYGEWGSEVISGLGFHKIRCFAGSFGAGILTKTMCTAPAIIEKSVLAVPSGIHNAFPISSMKMMIPLMKYLITKDDRYITQTALFMCISENILDADTLAILKDSFEHVKTKVGMPSNVSKKYIERCTAPTLVIAAELDCLFPAKKVLKTAKEMIPDCTIYELKRRGHMHLLTEQEQEMVIRFLL